MSEKQMKKVEERKGWLAVALALMVLLPTSLATAQERDKDHAAPRSQAATTSLAPSFDMRSAIPAVSTKGSSVGEAGRVQKSERGELARPREVILSALPQLTRMTAKPFEGYENDRPMTGLTEQQYMEMKGIVKRKAELGLIGYPKSTNLTSATGPKVPRPTPGGPLFASVSAFNGQGMIAACGGCVPSDMALGVGTNFVVQIVNSAIAVYDKNGNLQSGFPKDAASFFGLAAGTYTTDPRLIYDWTYHRWIAIMLTETSPSGGTNTGSLLIAASQGQDPRLGWWVYSPLQIGSAGDCPDYPTMGQDSVNWGAGATKGGFYVGINHFSGSGTCAGAHFVTNYVFFFPKDAFYAGAAFGYWVLGGFNFGGTLVDTLEPANMTDRADRPNAILLLDSKNIAWGNGVCSSGCNGLDVWTVSGPSTAPFNPFAFLDGSSAGPQGHGITISTAHNYSLPPLAASPGCTAGTGPCVDTNDTRISGQVKYHAGELFGSFNTGVATSPAVAGPIWFEVHPVIDAGTGIISSATERQEDCYLCGGWPSNGSAWFATLQPDPENNVFMGFEFASDAAYPGAAMTSRRATYGDSLMNGGGQYLISGQAEYPYGRWGDYTATAPDLTIANRPTMWLAGLYADSYGNWGTAIGWAECAVPYVQ